MIFRRMLWQTWYTQKKSEEQQDKVDKSKVSAILGNTKPVKMFINKERIIGIVSDR